MSLKDLGYKPRRNSEDFILDDTLRIELEEARAEHIAQRKMEARLDQGLGSKLPELQKRIDEAETAAREAAVSFVCQAIPRYELEDLFNEHPPTSEQLEEWKTQDKNNPLIVIDPPRFNYDTILPYLFAKSVIEPEASVDEWVEMYESGDWSDAIWTRLWILVWDKTNKGVTTLPTLGIGSAKTPASDPVSPTQ